MGIRSRTEESRTRRPRILPTGTNSSMIPAGRSESMKVISVVSGSTKLFGVWYARGEMKPSIVPAALLSSQSI